MQTIRLADVALSPEIAAVRERLRRDHGPGIDERVFEDDLRRLSVVLERCRDASSLLDVGCAHGILASALAGSIKRVVGVDQMRFGTVVENGWSHRVCDAESLPFTDGEFDTVTALEVIEHQPDGKFERVLAELRRVTSRRLIITVPWKEPTPLPIWHHQRFDEARVAALFPSANLAVLRKSRRGRVPWLLIEERSTRANPCVSP